MGIPLWSIECRPLPDIRSLWDGELAGSCGGHRAWLQRENVVGTFGILYGFAEVAEDGSEIWGTLAQSFTAVSAYSFLVFNLLCAPCFAATRRHQSVR